MRHNIVIEEFDVGTDCVSHSLVINTECLRELLKLIDDNGNISDLEDGYSISYEELQKICDLLQVDFDYRDGKLHIRMATKFDLLGYNTHTNRELYMMLRGEKPMAVFSDPFPLQVESYIPEGRFKPYVTDGRFLEKEFVIDLPKDKQKEGVTGIRFVIYTLKDESWRAETYKLIHEVSQKTGWNECFELIEGALLGYKEWENEIHINNYRIQHPREM